MRISVALCTFHGARFLPDQLGSLLSQTRPPDELVACDDDSADGTADVLRRFAAAAPFPVHVHVNRPRVGTTANFARALSLCSGDVVALCDQDDVWHPDKLARFAAAFADPAVGLAFSDADVVAEDLAPTGRRLWATLPFTPRMRAAVEAGGGPAVLARYNVVTGAAAAVRADLLPLVLPIPDGWFHDAWLGFVAAAVAGVRALPEPLVKYRQHGAQQVGAAARTLGWQVRRAAAAGADELRRAAANWDALAGRLRQVRGRLRDAGVIRLAEAKAAHTRARARVRGRPRPWRLAPAAAELLRGNYHRFGRGLRAFLADVLL